MAGRIVLYEPGSRKSVDLEQKMASAGGMESVGKALPGKPYPGMQKMTIQHILDGNRSNTPGAVCRTDPVVKP